MKNCSSCSNSAKVYCSACQDSYCTHCLVIKHLSSDSFESHSMTYVCEECEEGVAIKICDTCDQTMCLECDTSIHNKGKRAQHTRRSALESLILKKICNLAFLTLAYCNETLNIDSISPESLKTKFFELVTEMDQKTGDKNLISLIILETNNKPDQKKSQLLQNIKLKNVVILEENFQDLPWNQGKTNKLSKLDADINLFFDFKKSSSTLISLGFLENHDSIFVYDVTPTPNVGQFFNNNTPNSLPAKNLSTPNRNAENATTESLSFDQILTTTNSNSPKDLNTCLEASDESLCGDDDDSFDGNSLKLPENFSQQDISFSSFGVPQSSISDAWSLKESMTVNSFFSVSPDSKNNKTLSPQVGQPLREIEIQGSTKRGDVIQQVLMKFAEKGELLVPKEIAVSAIMELFKLNSPNHAEAILRECEAKKIVHTTVRKFLYDGPYFYIGLLLDTLTPESLAWVIRSIKNDLMTPTEKLVVSRIKECYGLKIEQNQWKLILDYLAVNQNFGGKKGSSLYTKKIQDPVTNMETNALYLRNEEWIPEDQGTVDDTTDEWKMFLIFMENFFNEEPQVQKRFDFNEDNNKNGMWHNSVENVLNKLPHDHDRGLRVSEDVRAIPGGRYGCAQFIKYCGPDNLKELSIGRLTLLVQEAINRGIIKYQRTLLVKNTVNDGPTALPGHSEFEAEVIHSINNERKAKVISMVREALLQILMEKENAEGVSLAQIPFYLKRKLKFAVDFQELGYPKLKNFLSTLKNLVVINSIGANHTYVKLKGPLPSQMVNDMTFHQQKNNKRQKEQQVLKKSPVPFTPVRNIDNHQNPAKNLNEEFSAILDTIDYITKQNSNGLTLQDLDMKLCDAIKGVIQFKIFGCQNFYDFLLQYADQIVDIEARKDCYIIYPKVSNFWNKDKPFYPPVLQQNNSFKSPQQQNYETPNRSFKSAESSTMHSGSRHFMSTGNYKNNSQNGFSVHHDSPLMSNAQTPAPTFNFPINCSTPSTAYSSHHCLSNTRDNFLNGSTMMGMSPMQDLGNYVKPDFVKKSRGLEHRNVNVSDWNSSFPFNNNKAMQEGVNNNQFGARNFRNFPQYAKGEEPDFENVRFIEGLIGDREENKNQFGYYRNVSNNNNMSTERSGLGYQGFRKNPMCKFVS